MIFNLNVQLLIIVFFIFWYNINTAESFVINNNNNKLLHKNKSYQAAIQTTTTKTNFNTVSITFKRRSLLFSLQSTNNNINNNIKMDEAITTTTITTTTITTTTMPNDEELEQILQVAIDAAKKAGNVIIGNNNGIDVVERKANSRDLLTIIDPLCEKIIKNTVYSTFPTHDFLGEEDVAPGKDASSISLETKLVSINNNNITDDNNDDSQNTTTTTTTNKWLWIVDPIDGTTNFVHGIPLCMPSIAVTYNGIVVVGVIYDCHRNELFTAIKGKGSYMNNQRIYVGQQTTLSDSIIAMGSPPAIESMTMSLQVLPILMPKVRTIRMLGSAALMLAWVANGRLTGYWEYDLSSWDICAGALLIIEAGGTVTNIDGTDFTIRTRKICTTNSLIHNELLSVLQIDAGIIYKKKY